MKNRQSMFNLSIMCESTRLYLFLDWHWQSEKSKQVNGSCSAEFMQGFNPLNKTVNLINFIFILLFSFKNLLLSLLLSLYFQDEQGGKVLANLSIS